MNVAILSSRTGWHTDELCRALAARGHVGCVLSYEALSARVGGSGPGLWDGDAPVLSADAVLARIIPGGSLEQVILRVDALHWIEARGLPVVNPPRAIERTVDKFLTTALLAEAGLPVPETVVCQRPEEAEAAVAAFGEAVVKPLFGSLGHGLMRVRAPEQVRPMARAMAQMRSVFYVQRAIDHGGRDFRVFVVGGRVLGAIERRAPDGQWRTNVAVGGLARAVEPTPEAVALAVRAAGAIGADYAGVDLLPSRDGELFVLEVNGSPGWRGLQQATGLDVAGAIVERLEARAWGRTPIPADAQPA
jgi:RimK family alpha-L-glutamate ligase